MQDNILGEFVRRTMNEKRLSSYEVSERSGRSISPSSVNKIINGDVKSNTIEKLKALAKGLGVSEDSIFDAARGKAPAESELDILFEFFEGDRGKAEQLRDALNALLEKEVTPKGKVVARIDPPTHLKVVAEAKPELLTEEKAAEIEKRITPRNKKAG